MRWDEMTELSWFGWIFTFMVLVLYINHLFYSIIARHTAKPDQLVLCGILYCPFDIPLGVSDLNYSLWKVNRSGFWNIRIWTLRPYVSTIQKGGPPSHATITRIRQVKRKRHWRYLHAEVRQTFSASDVTEWPNEPGLGLPWAFFSSTYFLQYESYGGKWHFYIKYTLSFKDMDWNLYQLQNRLMFIGIHGVDKWDTVG